MSTAERRGVRRLAAATVAGTVVFLMGMAAGGCVARAGGESPATGSSTDVGAASLSAQRSTGPGDRPVDAEPPTGTRLGWPHDEDGARRAGVAVTAASQGWLYLTDDALADSISAMATPGAAPRLIQEATSRVRLVRDAMAAATGQVWWVVQPLAARVASYSADRATVDVWAVSVLSAADVAVPQSSWATVTVEVAWFDGNWRVDGLSRRPGPTPVLDGSDQPWAPEALASALDGFELLPAGA